MNFTMPQNSNNTNTLQFLQLELSCTIDVKKFP